ncbi:MAG TPA: pantoate--beta-alanine ligase [Phycisphaerae bacterium]|nr:pantoate--beta-alanine ligase [Phycisphaerae bacterium]
MNVARSIDDVRRQVREARSDGKAIGLVPTMGNLHEGHLSLIDAAGRGTDFVVVSIFVNPAQFGPGEDYERYPRTPDEDFAACRGRGADLVFAPDVETMYPAEPMTEVAVKGLGSALCGRSRPAHFAGVCTVVAKLLNIVVPDKAFFGAKDFQQSVILRRMVRDLNVPVEIVVCPTVREADGLAMSSRNAYLSPEHRRQAPALQAALRTGAERIAASHPPVAEACSAMREHLRGAAPAAEVDYLEIVDPNTLQSVETTDRPVRIALAVRFGTTRLIDNIEVDGRRGES